MYKERFLSEIIQAASKMTKVILISGPRQVGKTTLLKHDFGNKIDYVTLDDIDALRLAKEDPKLFFKQFGIPIVIDEVQYAQELFSTIKLKVDEKEGTGLVYLTGSQAYHLMKNVVESLAGRIMIFELSSLSLREIFHVPFSLPFIPNREYLDKRQSKLMFYPNLWENIHRGSMPALLNEDVNWDWYYRDYVKTYIERDVRDLITLKDETKFYKFLVSIAARAGQMLVYNDIANDIGVTLKTVQNWTSILAASGIIHILNPYYNNVLKRVIKAPKIYFMDTGLLCYLVGWNTYKSAMSGAMSGNIFENFVVSEILKSFLNAGKDTRNVFYYRDKDKKEIDLLIQEDQTLYPIEIKMGATIRKDWVKNFNVLDKINNMMVAPSIVLCQIDRMTYINENAIAVPIEYI